MLELVIEAREKTAQWLDRTPWYAKVLLYPEYKRASRALEEMSSLEGRRRDAHWYRDYAGAANEFYDAVHDAIDAGFGFYASMERVPVIGRYAHRTVENAWQEMAAQYLPRMAQLASRSARAGDQAASGPAGSVYRMPTAPKVTKVVESVRQMTLEMLASEAAQECGGEVQEHREQFAHEYAPNADGYWLRSAVLGVAQAIGGLLDYVMGGTESEDERAEPD